MSHLPARIEGLPASLIDVAETLGVGVAVKLMQAFGGQEVKFPKAPGPDHPIIKALGEADGRALCDFLSGSLIYVPHGRARRSVRPEVLDLAAKGHDRREIARMLGISTRHVRRAANRADKGTRQPDLFD
jgi:Mor family transcriptional regulator